MNILDVEKCLETRNLGLVDFNFDNQACSVRLYSDDNSNLYLDLYVNSKKLLSKYLCKNGIGISCSNFLGKLFFVDNLGTSDPNFEDLGSRFSLYYASDEELSYLDVSEGQPEPAPEPDTKPNTKTDPNQYEEMDPREGCFLGCFTVVVGIPYVIYQLKCNPDGFFASTCKCIWGIICGIFNFFLKLF